MSFSKIGRILVWILIPGASWAFGAAVGTQTDAPQENASLVGKKVIGLEPVERVQIEMPDQSVHEFGVDLENTLITRFTQSGKFIVTDALHPMSETQDRGDDFEWTASVTPSARIGIRVDALSFQTGLRGERTFYGFNESFRTPWNDGKSGHENEFPLREVAFEPNWFDRTFDVKGDEPFGSASGLDLGDGLDINLLFAWVSLKYASYRADLHLRVLIDSPLLGKKEEKLVWVSGKGYYYDFAGAYSTWSVGIRLARKDAMEQALKNAIDGAYETIENAVSDCPLLAKVDAMTSQDRVLLGTGPGAA